MDKYIGTKVIEAEPAIKKGKVVYGVNDPIPKTMEQVEEGYRVRYEDGYVSWSPKNVFEKAYMKIIPNHNLKTSISISQEMVDGFIKKVKCTTLGNKTTLVTVVLVNGFEMIEASTCVDPDNYSEEIGKEICLDRIKNRIWEFLGFMLQTGVNGIKF